MRGRVAIEVGPDGETVVRIRASGYRRVIVAAKEALIGLVFFVLVGLIRNWWGQPGQAAALVAAPTIAVGLAAWLRSGEVVRIWTGLVVMSRPLRSFEVSRDEQATPQYVPVPGRAWFAQRWGNEAGSGVLLFGDDHRGVRFGEDLDEREAARVLAAFDDGAQSVESRNRGARHRVNGFLSAVLMLLGLAALSVAALRFGLSSLAALGLMTGAFLAVIFVADLFTQRFPRRIDLG